MFDVVLVAVVFVAVEANLPTAIVRMAFGVELVFSMDLKGFQNCFSGLQPAQKSWSFRFKDQK